MAVTQLDFTYQSQLPEPKWLLQVYIDDETKGGMLFETQAAAEEIGLLLLPDGHNEAEIDGGVSWTPS